MDLFPSLTPTILSITALNNYLRELLESDEVLQDVWVRGEISNFSLPRSGHMYFTLKDADAQVRCVMWKQNAQRLRFELADGMAVEAHGSMSVYTTSGQMQLYIDTMRPAGEGSLYQQFLQLKNRLEADGLFDPERKRPLPALPKHIGVITSASGAALHDMLQTLSRRLPMLRVTLAPTAVQGIEAPPGIVKALADLNALPDLDLILLARGGGSIEDLWAFNDEQVARAIAASRVPVISGVGHETDFTIADFAADLRAPTPTGAAELATPITQAEFKATVEGLSAQLDLSLSTLLSGYRQSLALAESELNRQSPRQRVANAIQRQDDLVERLNLAVLAQLRTQTLRLEHANRQLESLNPSAVLARGYAIVTDQATGAVISKVSGARPQQAINIRLQDGALSARIDSRSEHE